MSFICSDYSRSLTDASDKSESQASALALQRVPGWFAHLISLESIDFYYDLNYKYLYIGIGFPLTPPSFNHYHLSVNHTPTHPFLLKKCTLIPKESGCFQP